jgi:hypothetical protein
MTSLDSSIIEEYANLGIPADRIVADAHLASRFCDAVNGRLPESLQVEPATLNKRLLNLRRRGEANGGLPRLKHNHSNLQEHET